MHVCSRWIVALAIAIVSAGAEAQSVHGVLRVVKGDVQIKGAKTGQTTRARIGEKVYPKDVIVTGKESRAKIVMVDNNEINVSPESQIEIQQYEYDPAAGKKDVLLNVIYGKVRSKVEQKYDGKTSKFLIKTPSAVAGVRGTDFLTSYNRANDSSQVVTFHGKVEFGLPGPNGSISNAVMIEPGKMASVAAGGAPTAPAAIPKEELAKVDQDSKADTAKGGASPSNDQRAPAKDSGTNKDDKKSETTPAGEKDNGSAKENQNSPAGANRQPNSVAGPTAGPTGGCTSMAGCGAPPPPPPPPPVVNIGGINIPPPITPLIPVCDKCREIIEDRRTDLIIKVRSQ